MTKHSRKLIIVALLTALVASPTLAAGPSADSTTSMEASWAAVLDVVESWLSAVLGSNKRFPNVDPNGGERSPKVDPNGESFPHVDPNGDEACSAEPCEERFPNVDPNG